jgi:putative ABC transport system permease protein
MSIFSLAEAACVDLRDALRRLHRRPLITAMAFLLLTIGIGASVAAFSVAYGVLVRPLPFPDADRLAVLWEEVRGRRGQLSYPDYQDLRERVPFDAATVFASGRATVTGGAQADRVNLVQGAVTLLPLLGARPLAGRLLEPQDEGRSVIVVSHRLWQSVLHGDPQVVGRPLGLSGTQYTVVGVTAPGLDFELPVGGGAGAGGFTIKDVDVWLPFNAQAEANNRAISTYQSIVKLQRDQTIERAQAAVDVVAGNLARTYPSTNLNRGFRLAPLADQIAEAKSPALLIACGGALLILLIACANLASLLAGDLAERRRDFAVREALGASRGRLVRQLVIESALLSIAAGAAGLLLARALVTSVKAAADLPRLDAIRFDLPVAACALVAALAAGVASRLVAVGGMGRARDDLRASISSYAASAPRLRRALVVVQLALAVVLSAAAILLAVSLRRLILVDPGFAGSHVLTARVSAYPARYPNMTAAFRFFDDLVLRIAAQPGVRAAAAASVVPFAGGVTGTSVGVEGRLAPMAERASAGWQTVTPGYFHALGIPILSGRDFVPADAVRPMHQTVINQALARRLFGDERAIGRRLAYGASDPVTDWHEVVGVVGDVRHGNLADAAAPRAYDLIGQHGGRTVYLVAAGAAGAYDLAPVVRDVARQADPEAPVFEVQSLDDILNGTITPRRLATGFSMGLAGVSLLLSAIGLYGLLASSVAARSRELAIRRALGSSTAGTVRLVFAEAAALVIAGAIAGGAAAFGASRVIQSQLFGVEPTDPRVVVAV